MSHVSYDKVFSACKVLFGPEVLISTDFLDYLQASGVKSAYREKAMITHPDRLITADEETRRKGTDLFIETNEAYSFLLDYIKNRENDSVRLYNSAGQFRERRSENGSARFYAGPIPGRKLFFAEFLYYSGIIPWQRFIEAIVWQRRQRPRFGEIAKRWSYLSDIELASLIARRLMAEPIGETALRLNFMNRFQVNSVLLYQRVKQRRIGEFFVELGILQDERIKTLLDDFRVHNLRFERGRSGHFGR